MILPTLPLRLCGSRRIVVFALAIISLLPALDATYMLAKAELAQKLIERSWHQTGDRPWPWADTSPVARLTIPRLALNAFVLDGATGASLAFGPGLVSGSSDPGALGVTMIAAHRDTHFKTLEGIQTKDIIELQDSERQWHRYRVESIGIADSRVDHIQAQNDQSRLILTTCYPFDALTTGGPLRFVVEAQLLGS